MKIQLKYKKPYGIRYDCYYNDVKINKRFHDDLPKSGTIVLIERNSFLSKLWWLIAIFNLACGLLGSFDDWKEERTNQKIIFVNYQNILSDEMIFEIIDKGQSVLLHGVETFSVNVIEEENPKIVRRIKSAQKLLVIIPLTVVVIIFIILAVCLM